MNEREDLRNSSNYYNLEACLFDCVTKSFARKSTLNAFDFYAIISWKSNRSITKVKKGLKSAELTPRALMSKVAECAGDEVRMKVLVEEVAGIGVPIASAILTVCYPDRFTILDYRAWEALFHFKKVESKSIPVDIGSYFNYLGKCREMAREKNMSLRELDHALWGWSKRNSIINLACRKLI